MEPTQNFPITQADTGQASFVSGANKEEINHLGEEQRMNALPEKPKPVKGILKPPKQLEPLTFWQGMSLLAKGAALFQVLILLNKP